MIEYEAREEIRIAIEKMLSDKKLVQFNAIRDNEIAVHSLMCIRTDKDGEFVIGKGKPITCRKMTPPMQVLTEGHYLVIVDYYFWEHSNEIQRNANLFHALMHIQVDKDEESGKIKMGTRKPEVQVFTSEVALFGAHSLELLDMREAMKNSAKKFAEDMRVTA